MDGDRHSTSSGSSVAFRAAGLRPNLLFIMSFSTSLKRWQNAGMFDREVALLNRFAEDDLFERVVIFTYDPNDVAILNEAKRKGLARKELSVYAPNKPLSGWASRVSHSIFGGLRAGRDMSEKFVIRTNQISGSWTGILLKLRFRQPLILRCGYSLSKRFSLQGKRLKSHIARALEYIGLRQCDVCFVSSRDVLEYFSSFSDSRKIVLTPTFVDSDLFIPRRPLSFSEPVLYVGRLEAQKNVEALLLACGELNLEIHLYGEGTLRGHLEALVSEKGIKASFFGLVANRDLPEIYRQYSLYVLPSNFDPMPKTLIEAMASGLVCVTTPTAGGQELIRNGETGYVTAGFSPTQIRDTIELALGEKRTELGDHARKHVEENNTLVRFLARERAILVSLTSGSNVGSTAAQDLGPNTNGPRV